MARPLPAPADQIRLVFRTTEAELFLRGWEPVPSRGGMDPLNQALRQSFIALEGAFPGAAGHVEVITILPHGSRRPAANGTPSTSSSR